MKRNWRNSAIRMIGRLMLFLLIACSENKMTMPEEANVNEDLEQVAKAPNEIIVSTIKTTSAEFKLLPVVIQTQGIVTYDSRYVSTIPTRIGGRLEKVYMKYVFQPVMKGQKVADIYSPELLTAQRELVYLIEHDQDNQSMIEAAKDKLLLLGVSREQVESIAKNKEVSYTFPIVSSQNGYIVSGTQSSPVINRSGSTASIEGGSMGEMEMNSNAAPSLQKTGEQSHEELVRDGNYVTAGQTLFRVVNARALRIELNLPIAQVGLIKLGDAVMLGLDKDEAKGHVDFVQPFFSDDVEFIKVRLYLNNSHRLRIGQLIQATMRTQVEALWLPREAILNLGQDRIVFLKDQNIFKPRRIVTGIQTEGKIEVKQGISSADEVAVNAQYLVDSESFIKPKQP